MSGIANFLKHADRDPDAVLSDFHPDLAMPVIGLATLLYRRVAGYLSLKMQALDSWIEMTGAEELGIEELDRNAERAQATKRVRDALKLVPRDAHMRFAREYFEFFLKNRDRLEAEMDGALAAGATLQDLLDKQFAAAGPVKSPPPSTK